MTDESARKLPTNAIPFVLAAAGHRDLVEKDIPSLRRKVAGLIKRLADRMTSTPLLLLTGLAEGADQLIAEVALDHGAYLAVVLPLPEGLYRSLMSDSAKAKFDTLRARASLVISRPLLSSVEQLEGSASNRNLQYKELAEFLAKHCQALIALWDGHSSDEAGGTFEVVKSVLAGADYKDCIEPLRGVVYQIVTPRKKNIQKPVGALELHVLRCPGELDSTSKAAPIAYFRRSRRNKGIEEDWDASSLKDGDFERWRLEPRQLFWRCLARQGTESKRTIASWRARLWQQMVEPSTTEERLNLFNEKAKGLKEGDYLPWRLQPATWKREPWPYLNRIDLCFRASDVIALKSQRAKNAYLFGILFFVLLAALVGATHVELLESWDGLWVLFPACLLIALVIHWWAGMRGVENWFQDSRVLAEALRVQYFWELGGVRKPVWRHYLVHRPSELGWVITALRGLSLLCHELPSPAEPTAYDVRGAISGWVEDQAAWYARKSKQQHLSLALWETLSNVALGFVMTVSLVYGLIMTSDSTGLMLIKGLRWLPSAHLLVAGWGHWIHWLIAILSVAVGLFKIWLEQSGYDEQARNYRRMGHLFAHRKKKLGLHLAQASVMDEASLTNSDEVKQSIAVICELGIKALEENSIWLIMHREHPLKVTSGG